MIDCTPGSRILRPLLYTLVDSTSRQVMTAKGKEHPAADVQPGRCEGGVGLFLPNPPELMTRDPNEFRARPRKAAADLSACNIVRHHRHAYDQNVNDSLRPSVGLARYATSALLLPLHPSVCSCIVLFFVRHRFSTFRNSGECALSIKINHT